MSRLCSCSARIEVWRPVPTDLELTPPPFEEAWPFEDPEVTCKALGISEFEFHRQCIQIRGVHLDADTADRAKATFECQISFRPRGGTTEITPARVPVVGATKTPYVLSGGRLLFSGSDVLLNYEVEAVPLRERNRGYTFPHITTDVPFLALRVNPKVTGRCPGRCQFCQREMSYRDKPGDDHIQVKSPKVVIDDIVARHGERVLHEVRYVTLITELFGREKAFLDYADEFRRELLDRGFSPDGDFGILAQDVRSESGLQHLMRLVNPPRYQYTLETFTRRSEIMSRYKGIPLPEVINILRTARAVGFPEIQINLLAGVDSLQSLVEGIETLADLRLVDSIGFNTFTLFFENSVRFRHPDAWSVAYYKEVCDVIRRCGIAFHKPETFEFGSPFAL